MIGGIPNLAPRAAPSPIAVARLVRDAEATVHRLRHSPTELPRGPGALRDLSRAFGGLLTGLQAVGAGEWLREADALRLGRAVAAGLHLRCQGAFAERFEAGGAPRAETLDRMLLTAERRHRVALLRSRSAARRADMAGIQDVLHAVVEDGHGALAALCRSIGSLPAGERGHAARGLRVSRLARRSALLAAATLWLGWRVLSGLLRDGTTRIAANRPLLARSDPRLRMAARRLGRLAEGERTAAVGRVVEVQWIERPDVPYSRATLAEADFEIRVHRRNMARLGVAPGGWLWARGKVERGADGRPVLIAEFEGPGQHAGRVWEDWLADGVRAAYDLAPSVVFAEWELPGRDRPGAEADLRSRIARVLAVEEG